MRTFAVVLLLATLIAGCSGPALEVEEPPAALQDVDARLRITSLWTYQVGTGAMDHYLRLPALVDGDRVFAADRFGNVSAFASGDGWKKWYTKLDSSLSTGPGDAGSLLLLGGDAEVIALSKNDGVEYWRTNVSSEVLSTPLRHRDVVLVRTVDGKVFGLDAETGRVKWEYGQNVPALSLRGVAQPSVSGNYVAVGFANGYLALLDINSGKPYWENRLAVPRGRTELERLVDVDTKVVIADGVVYAGSYQNGIVALAIGSGEVLWNRDISTYHDIAVIDNALFVVDEHSDVWALARYNGGTLWKQTELHARQLTAPATQGGYLITADAEGYIHWLSAEDGGVVARTRYDNYPFLSTPVVVGDIVYVNDVGGEVAAFRVSLKDN